MIVRLAYGKITRDNRTFSPATAITTYVESDNLEISPLGAAGTTAPSTMVIDHRSGTKYTLAKAFSATHAALTAATATENQVNLL
jgi:multisubunit Na+/H+ antiporter MnhE subunit